MEKKHIKKCLRCNGAMFYDKFYSAYGQFWGWRCLICGEIVDQVILMNRQSKRVGQAANLPGSRQAMGC
ncbi:MAG: hypothetical protein AB1558_05850 [Thermodesulfobacteriota bacterium]